MSSTQNLCMKEPNTLKGMTVAEAINYSVIQVMYIKIMSAHSSVQQKVANT